MQKTDNNYCLPEADGDKSARKSNSLVCVVINIQKNESDKLFACSRASSNRYKSVMVSIRRRYASCDR